MKFGNLNFPEHSGQLQASNGIALPIPLPVATDTSHNVRLPLFFFEQHLLVFPD